MAHGCHRKVYILNLNVMEGIGRTSSRLVSFVFNVMPVPVAVLFEGSHTVLF